VIDTEEDLPEPVIVLGAAQYEAAEPEPEPVPEEDDIAEPPAPACLYCGGSLPTNRQVNFCPHCGQSQTRILCPECRSEVEQGWRHCVNCGAAVGE
jgi:tRNA(Ile2) C34 agmatinyltransferase TiaS